MMIAELKHYANLYSLTDNGECLNDIDWRKNRVFIVDGQGLGSRGLGGIILIDPESDSIQSNTYIHELRHEWQRKQQEAIKYAIRNLFKKNEPDAEARKRGSFNNYYKYWLSSANPELPQDVRTVAIYDGSCSNHNATEIYGIVPAFVLV